MNYVLGAGPLGRGIISQLESRGETATVITRRAVLLPDGFRLIQGSILDAAVQNRIEDGSTIFHCANAPYHRWPQDLPPLWEAVANVAGKTKSRVIVGTNLYAYGRPHGPITEGHIKAPCSKKGQVRLQVESSLAEAAAAGQFPCALVRASDFFGPGGCESALGDRFFGPIVRGKDPVFVGDIIAPHSYTYLPDFARTMIAAADRLRDAAAGAQEWIVPNSPPRTAVEVSEILADMSKRELKTRVLGAGILAVAGVFSPGAREMIEMLYEFREPFFANGEKAQDELGVLPTPIRQALATTLEWYQESTSTGATVSGGAR